MKTTHSACSVTAVFSQFSSLFNFLNASPNEHPNVEQRVNALLAQMTLEEKLGQLQQLDGEGNGNFRPEHLDLIRKGLLGSTLNVRGAHAPTRCSAWR